MQVGQASPTLEGVDPNPDEDDWDETGLDDVLEAGAAPRPPTRRRKHDGLIATVCVMMVLGTVGHVAKVVGNQLVELHCERAFKTSCERAGYSVGGFPWEDPDDRP